jgi:hypothetical protein
LANRVRRSRRQDEESAGSLAGTFFKLYAQYRRTGD